VEPLVVG